MKYQELCEQILAAVGGRENIKHCFHCATRLRLNLKDMDLVDQKALGKIREVCGKKVVGDQLQLIIGSYVSDVYADMCALTGLTMEAPLEEQSGGFSWSKLGNRLLNTLSGCFIPLIPVIVSASLIKMFATVLGPTMMNVISDTNDLYTLFTFVGDAGFYFLPVMIAYNASKQFGVNSIMAMFVGGIMLHPTLVGLVNAGTPFTVYGIPMTLVNYASSTVPLILIIWVMSYVEKFFNRYVPKSLRMVFSPLLTILVMLPVALCVIGPLGTLLGNGFTNLMLAIADLGIVAAILVSALSGALWNVLVLFGMHLTFYMTFIQIFISTGSDGLIGPGTVAATVAIAGMTAGALLRVKGKENKGLVSSYLIAQVIGGVTEPSIFGVGIRYKMPFVGACLGGAAGAVYYAVVGAKIVTLAAAANFMCFAGFAGGDSMNFVHGVIGGAIAFIVAFLFTYFFGFKKEDLEETVNEE